MFISHDISSAGLLILFWAWLFQILFFKIQSQCNHAILSHFSSRKLFIKYNHAKVNVCLCTNKPRQKGRLRLNNYCTVFPLSRQFFFVTLRRSLIEKMVKSIELYLMSKLASSVRIVTRLYCLCYFRLKHLYPTQWQGLFIELLRVM